MRDIQFISPVNKVERITRYLDLWIYAFAKQGITVDKINVGRNLEVQNYDFLNVPLSNDYTFSVRAVFRAACGPSLEESSRIPDGEPPAICLFGWLQRLGRRAGEVFAAGGGAAAIVHCMIKQNGRRAGFSNPAASSFRDISPETMALCRNGIYELFRRI